MRNLKRVFSLALSLVMALSITTTSLAASVENYTDVEQLEFVEQVDLLSALKIMEGNETGAFNPKANITRAEAATIIARLVLSREVADDLGYTTSQFSDMGNHAWAIKYVEACANMEIINGVGGKLFNPGGMVTGYEFAKMLLVAVGYGQNKEYVGTSWMQSVAIDAHSVNLFAGTSSEDLTAPATREECALYAFNALTAVDTVDYAPLLNTYTSDGLFKDEEGTTLGEELYGLGCATTTELDEPNSKGIYTVGKVKVADDLSKAIGRSVRVWYVTDNKGNTAAVTGAYYDDVVLGSNCYGYSFKEMTTPSKDGFICKADDDIVVYVNGAREDENGRDYSTSVIGGTKGVEVTFVDTAKKGLYDGVADKVFVVEKEVAQLTKDPTVRTRDNETTVKINGITDGYVDAETVIGYEDVVYGDVVLFWTDVIGNLHIEKAESFTGELTGTKRLSGGGVGYVIDEEAYILSDLTGAAALTYSMYDVSGAPSAADREYVYYVDNGGYIVAAIPVEEALSEYVVIAELAVIRNQGVDTSAYVQALLVDMEGNKMIVDLASVRVNAADRDENGTADSFETYKGIGTDSDDLIVREDGDYVVNEEVADLVGNTFWTYSEGNSGYALSSVYEKTVNGVEIEVGSLTRTEGTMNDIKNGKARFADGLTGNDQTVFVVYNAKTNKFDVYEGVDNVPNIELASTSETGYIENDGFVEYVFIGKNAIDSTSAISEETAFLLSTDPIRNYFNNSTGAGYGVYQAIVDGEVTTVKVKMSTSDVRAEGIGYKTVYYDGEYIVDIEDCDKAAEPQNGYDVSGRSLRLADDADYSYSFKSDAVAFIVDADRSDDVETTTIDELSDDENDTVYVILSKSGSSTASFIVVYENDPAAEITITTQPEEHVYAVCDDVVVLEVDAEAEDSHSRYLSYQWYVSEDADFENAEAIRGETDEEFTVPTETTGVCYYFVKVTHERNGMQTTYAISNPAMVTVLAVVETEDPGPDPIA